MTDAVRGAAAPSRWLARVAILVAAVLAYWSGLNGAFLFDDHRDIVTNTELDVLWPPWEAMGLSFRPLVYWSFAVNRAISGDATWSYHAVTLALHVLTAWVLFGLGRRLLRHPRIRWADRDARGTAAAIALLWSVHPLGSQAVLYIVQRAEVMGALAYLVTLLAFVRAVEAGPARTHRGWAALSVATFWVGLGCKEVIATAPLAVYLLDAVLHRSFRLPLRRRWKLYAAYAAPFVLAPSWWLVTNPERFVLVRPDRRAPPPWTYFLSQGLVLLEYLRLAVWPVGLNLDHGWHPAQAPRALAPAFALVAMLFLGAAEGVRRHGLVGWTALAAFLVLGPSSSLFPLADFLVEHRMYLPLAACVALAVLGVRWLLRRTLSASGLRRGIGTALVIGATCVLGSLTHVRGRVYGSPEIAWSDVARKSPRNPRAHYNLALALIDTAPRRAERHLRRALEFDRTHRNAHVNLGALLYQRGDVQGAAHHFRIALTIGRKHPFEFLFNYAGTLATLGRLDEAVVVYERALDQLTREREKAPEFEARTRSALGSCLRQLDRNWEAVAQFERALVSDPGLQSAHDGMLEALLADGRADEAVARFERRAAAHPESVAGWLRLGRAQVAAGRVGEAIDSHLAVLERHPGHSRASTALARLCLDPANREAARDHLQRVETTGPARVQVTQLLGALRAQR